MMRTPTASTAAAPNRCATRSAISRLFLDNLEELAAVLLLCVIGAVTVAQVVLRTLFSHPLSWPEELSQFLFAWACTLGAIGAYKRLGLVRLDLLTRRLSPSVQRALRYSGMVLVAILLAILGWKGYQLASRTSFSAATLPVTWAWAYAAAPAFATLMISRMIQLELFGYRYRFIEEELTVSQAPIAQETKP